MRQYYIAGPISGKLYTEVVLNFWNAKMHLYDTISRFMIIYSPLDLCSPQWNWETCMKQCLKVLKGGVTNAYFLKGWQNSEGCKIEHAECLRLGIEISYEK